MLSRVSMSTCTALIVAAGRGSRFGGPLPKQYALLAGQPVLRHTIEAYRAAPAINGVRVVIAAGDQIHYETAVAGLGLQPPVLGGATRQRSVLNGLEALAADAAVAERAGLKVVMVEGSEDNRKITTADDLARSVAMETRTAFGLDVHGFGPGNAVMLGGVAIAHTHTLTGHSDADVALH